MALEPRAAAALVIGDVLAGSSLNQSLPPRLARVAARDRGLVQHLCYGTLRHEPRLQGLLAQLLKKPLRDKDSDVRGLLLCGLFQLESTRIPDHAAVASTVGAVSALKKAWAKGMVNAVLRRFLRERDSLSSALAPAAAASHPPWLYEALQQQWPDDAASIIEANNCQPPMTLRVNARLTTRPDYLQKLAARGIEAAPGQLSPHAIILAVPCDVTELPGFERGEVSVQDEAAQLAAPALQPKPGEYVLDACAAPGGKACHLLELEPRLAGLVAMDVDESRLQKVADNLQRLGLKASMLVDDACRPGGQLAPASFDRILVDAPCSATGVIRRHPDIKVLRRQEDIRQLAALQLAILQGLWPLLKPGGSLLYATCSVLDEENSQVVRRFLGLCPEADHLPLAVSWGRAVAYGRQLLPSANGTDGLFYSLLAKNRLT